MKDGLYVPDIARITEIKDETPDVKTFTLEWVDPGIREMFRPMPGQFVEVSVMGVGEAPIGISSIPDGDGRFQITVRAVGSVTRALHGKKPGDIIGIRGPLGNWFPAEMAKGKIPLFVGGGIGLPPLRSLIRYMLAKPDEYPKMTVLYGARTPSDLVYKDELKEWKEEERVDLYLTVDVGDESWTGKVGLVTELFKDVAIDYKNAIAFVCGPPIMIHFVILNLLELGVPEDMIFSTLERHMKCGVRKCGHCAIGHKYVCADGPVFSYAQLKELAWQSGERPT